MTLPYIKTGIYSAMMNPPFDFRGIVSRVFPLRADMDRLRSFCDDYLNVAPNIAHFEPLIPYVDLVIMNYEEMTSQSQTALAVFSQNEILFQVPLLWTNPKTGEQRQALVDPYIFVNNEVSAAAGREIYGWPKERAWFQQAVSSFAYNPTAARRLVSVGVTKLTPTGVVPTTLLDVTRDELNVSMDFSRQPFANLELQSLPPWMDPSQGPRALASLLQRGVWMGVGALRGLGLQGLQAFSRPEFNKDSLSFLPLPRINAINLKQFADAIEPGRACYKALTNTPLQVTRVKRVGLIGERQQLSMDPTGGCRVRIADDPTRPIVRRLGLVVESERTAYLDGAWPNEGARTERSTSRIFTLRPECPYWLESNLRQEASETLCWRSWGDEDWCVPEGVARARKNTKIRPAAAPKRRSNRHEHVSTTDNAPPYTGVLGARLGLALGSPLELHQAAVRYLTLEADETRLREYLATINEVPTKWRVELDTKRTDFNTEHRACLYLVVWDINGLTAADSTMPWFEGHSVGFFIPVKLTHPKKPSIRAMYPAFSFADRAAYVHAERESMGGNVSFAEIDAGEDPWLQPNIWDQRHLFNLRTLAVQQFGVDDDALTRILLDVSSMDISAANLEEKHTEYHGKDTSFYAAPLLSEPPSTTEHQHDGEIHVLRIKQFPHASDTSTACYQALTLSSYQLQPWDSEAGKKLEIKLAATPKNKRQGGHIDAVTFVRVFDYQSHPLRKDLGLLNPRFPSLDTEVRDGAGFVLSTDPEPGVASHLYRSQDGYTWFQAPIVVTHRILWSSVGEVADDAPHA